MGEERSHCTANTEPTGRSLGNTEPRGQRSPNLKNIYIFQDCQGDAIALQYTHEI
ncbi:hypothetical protein [Phormidium sp. CCY1219]|uniref:hypothetical protein n=1 Tax=Phormidium sp. CCY1219 TaxID=2886104 RepID=UPI002D1F27EC|nr:hypothetical protein [Phormidium sp. CCY1219]MEB3827752.1 hypothetical protein [Phormidium sp. CCY1219]